MLLWSVLRSREHDARFVEELAASETSRTIGSTQTIWAMTLTSLLGQLQHVKLF
jgi:hypothetical protein